jgi:predicted dehydrogenase
MSSTATSKLSVLIVGCGQIAGGYDADHDDALVRTHAKALTRHGGFRLAACVDPDAERRGGFRRRWGVAEDFAGLDAVAERRFDLACLCSPPEFHAAQLDTLLAMDVGMVFCEKPLTAAIAESRRLVAAYAAKGRPLAVNYLRRWDPAVAELAAEIAAGHWGGLLSAEGLYTKGIFANGSHLIDLAHCLLGPLAPRGVTRVVADYLPHDPTLEGWLHTATGAPLYLRAGDCRRFTVFELDLLFEAGRVSFTESGFTIRRRRVVPDARFDGYRVLEAGESRPTGLGTAMLDAVGNLHRHHLAGEPLASTGVTALAAHDICAALMGMADDRRTQ